MINELLRKAIDVNTDGFNVATTICRQRDEHENCSASMSILLLNRNHRGNNR